MMIHGSIEVTETKMEIGGLECITPHTHLGFIIISQERREVGTWCELRMVFC